MEDTKKSIIIYENMMITPDLLRYLGFTDITSHIRGLNPETVFYHLYCNLIVRLENLPADRMRSLKRKFPASAYNHLTAVGGLRLKGLIDSMMQYAKREWA